MFIASFVEQFVSWIICLRGVIRCCHGFMLVILSQHVFLGVNGQSAAICVVLLCSDDFMWDSGIHDFCVWHRGIPFLFQSCFELVFYRLVFE